MKDSLVSQHQTIIIHDTILKVVHVNDFPTSHILGYSILGVFVFLVIFFLIPILADVINGFFIGLRDVWWKNLLRSGAPLRTHFKKTPFRTLLECFLFHMTLIQYKVGGAKFDVSYKETKGEPKK